MSDFKTKMHRIRCPDHTGGAYSGPPILQLYLRGRWGKGEKGRRREGKGKGKVKGMEAERRFREGFGPPKNFGVAPPMPLVVLCQ